MHTCVADGFVTDAVNLITDDGMHLPGVANHRKCDRHGAGDEAVFSRAPETVGQVVGLRRPRAQGIQRRPSFLCGSSKPNG